VDATGVGPPEGERGRGRRRKGEIKRWVKVSQLEARLIKGPCGRPARGIKIEDEDEDEDEDENEEEKDRGARALRVGDHDIRRYSMNFDDIR